MRSRIVRRTKADGIGKLEKDLRTLRRTKDKRTVNRVLKRYNTKTKTGFLARMTISRKLDGRLVWSRWKRA